MRVKRLIAAVLTLCLLLTMMLSTSISVSAASGKHGNLSWSVENGTLTISGYGDMQQTSSSDYPWDNYKYTSVVIRDGVTSIAPYAFFMNSCYDITIPLSVTNIGHRATYAWGAAEVYYGGSIEDRRAFLTIGEWNHGLSLGTWHYSAHRHQWTLKSTTSATCTTDGVKTYSCHCGQTKTETTQKLGHNYSGSPSYKWTQANSGYSVTATQYCSRNSSHYITETVKAAYQQISAATCTADGQDRYTATFTNSAFTTQTKNVTVSATGHSYTSVVTKPTCTEKGFTTHTCSKCGHEYVDSYVEVTEHPWDSGKVTKEPTCKEEGEKTYTCTVCSATKTEPIEKTTNHTWDSGKITKEPTCVKEGTKTYTCEVCGKTRDEAVAVVEHSYGDWEDAGDTEHKHTCSVCKKEETASHSWDSGSITKQPSCAEDGVKTYTCKVCGKTREEYIPGPDHSYGNWANADSTKHKRTCTACGNEETADHTWNSGSITKQPTCKEEGEKTYTCTVCGGTKVEPVAKLTDHTYDNDCDTSCNVCGIIRTVTHKYLDKWSKDKTNHWHECSECGHKKDEGKHKPGAAATETSAQVCTVCQYIIQPPIKHTVHKFGTKWITDKNGHWHVCSGCEEKSGYAEHAFENDCDTDCSVCGFTRKTSHSFATTYQHDEVNHWYECSVCGEKKDISVHEPGPEATATTAQVCTICGLEIVPALGEPETTVAPTEEEPATTAPAAPSDDDATDGAFPWWIILIAAAAVVVVVVVIKKKR